MEGTCESRMKESAGCMGLNRGATSHSLTRIWRLGAAPGRTPKTPAGSLAGGKKTRVVSLPGGHVKRDPLVQEKGRGPSKRSLKKRHEGIRAWEEVPFL